MKIYTNIRLNVSRTNVLKNVFAKQRDSNSRYLDCAFFDGTNKFLKIVSGDIVINAMRADGTYRSFAGSINDNGTVRVPLTNWMLDVAGTLSCSVTVYEGDEKLTTATFVLTVQPSENPTGTVSPDDPNVDLAEQLVERCEAAVEEMEYAFNGAGIHEKTYVTEVDEMSVVTESTDIHPSYYAYVAERVDNFYRGSMYRITLDGTEYILPANRWFWSGSDGSTFWSKGVTFIGDLSLFCDASGYYDKLPDVPFVLTNMYSLFPLVNDKIFLFTETAGAHTIKIERIDYDLTEIPASLIYGSELKPIHEIMQERGNYTATCIGVNDMRNRKSTFAFGDNNTVTGDGGVVIGNDNLAGGQASICIGNRNETHGAGASAFGYQSKAVGSYAESHGAITEASGMMSTTHGFRTKANHKSQFVFGEYNVEDDSTANANSRGKYVEIVGNGAKNALSNARTLDWQGNESLAGGLTLGKGTADEVTLSAAQLKRLLALLS